MPSPSKNRRSPRRLTGWKLAAARVAAACFASAFMVVVLEIGLRVIDVRLPTATVMGTFFEYDSELGWRGRAGATGRFVTANFQSQVSHDARGFRSAAEASEGRERGDADAENSGAEVWCIGDSMTWGWGVDDGRTFVDRLARDARRGTRFRNFGVPGYSAVQEYLLLRRELAAGKRPDKVVIYFVENDWRDNLEDPQNDPPRPWAEPGADGWRIAGTPVPPTIGWAVRSWFTRNSYAFGFVNYHLKRWRQARHAPQVARELREKHGVTPNERELAAMRFVYGELKASCAEHGVALYVATGFRRSPAIETICAELDLPLIRTDRQLATDDELTTSDPDRRLYFATDPHLTERGHALAARAIAAELKTSEAVASEDETGNSGAEVAGRTAGRGERRRSERSVALE